MADIVIVTVCPRCGKVSKHVVNAEAYAAWNEGKLLIQDAFPNMKADEREELLSGICGKCWDAMFSEDDQK